MRFFQSCRTQLVFFAILLSFAPVFAGISSKGAVPPIQDPQFLYESPASKFNSLMENHYSRCKRVFTGNGCKSKTVPKGSDCGWQSVDQQYMAAMGLNFLRQACRCAESPIKQFMVAPNRGHDNDLLNLSHLAMNSTLEGEAKQMVRLYSTLFTLGHRESSGNFNAGKDGMASWFSDPKRAEEWEAGLFQASTNSLALDGKEDSKLVSGENSLPKKVFVNYISQLFTSSPTERAMACDLNLLGGTKSSKSTDIKGGKLSGLFGGTGYCARVMSNAWGSNPEAPERAIRSNDATTIDCFRGLQQNCPAFAIEYTAVVARINRTHWGPLRRHDEIPSKYHRPYIVPACSRFFEDLYQRKDEFCSMTAFRNEGVQAPELSPAQNPPAGSDPGVAGTQTAGQDPGVNGFGGPGSDPGVGATSSSPVATSPAQTQNSQAADANVHVLNSIKALPKGGTFALNSPETIDDLSSAVTFDSASGRMKLNTQGVDHGNCSTGTMMSLVGAIESDQKQNNWNLGSEAGEALKPKKQKDGVGFWGRWNANGPGVARIFKDLKLGRNFIDQSLDPVPGAKSEAPRQGDYVKLFWNNSKGVGKNEAGHMAVFTRYVKNANQEITEICFWSVSDSSHSTNNFSGGFGEKCVPRARVQHAIFSRLENPRNIEGAKSLPEKDVFLEEMLTKEISFEDALRASDVL